MSCCPRESADKHEQRGLRQVEVRKEQVRCPKAVAGLYEKTRVSAIGRNGAVGLRCCLQQPQGGSAHSYNAAAILAAFIDDPAASAEISQRSA